MTFIIEAAQIELLAKCNFKCNHCSNSIQDGNKIISIDKCKSIVNQLIEHKIKLIVISGGEPLLYKDLKTLVEYIASKKINVRINTNGYELHKHIEWIKQLKEYVSLQISLDGYDETTFQKIRNINAFCQIIDNIKMARKEDIKVLIKTILSRDTVIEYSKFAELAKELKCDFFLNFMAYQGRAKQNEELLLRPNELLVWHNVIRKHYPNNIQSGIFKKDHCQLIFTPGVITRMRITNNGNCFPCITFSDEELSMGNLFESSLNEILSNYPLYRKKLLEAMYNPHCLKCGNRKRTTRPGCISICKYYFDSNCAYFN